MYGKLNNIANLINCCGKQKVTIISFKFNFHSKKDYKNNIFVALVLKFFLTDYVLVKHLIAPFHAEMGTLHFIANNFWAILFIFERKFSFDFSPLKINHCTYCFYV